MQSQYNMRNPAVKRLMKEAQELREPTEQYYAQPLDDNLFEWHFTIRGPGDSEFDGGVYHGRIILPPEYPMKPPSIILLTPNGRFEIFKKICLSISGHHPESWQPSWSIRTALLAIIGFMPTHGNGAIGSLDYTPEERKVLARKSQEFKCTECGAVKDKLKEVTEASDAERQEAKELASQINFQAENKSNGKDKSDKPGTSESGSTPKSDSTMSSTAATTSASTTTSAAGQMPNSFPGFNPAMFGAGMPFPPGGFPMPPFMFPPGMRPPTTNATGVPTSSSPFAMPPPGFIPPPFWPPMMPGAPMPGATSSQRQTGPFPFPPSPFFMPPAAMFATPQRQATNKLASSRSTASSTASSTAESPGLKSRANTTTVPSSTAGPVSSSQVATQPKTASPPSSSTTSQDASSPSASNFAEATSTSTNSPSTSTSPTPGATRSTTTTEVRQRNVGQGPATRPQPVHEQFNNAPIASDQNVRQSEHPLVILLMALLGIAILALLVRRVYMMNTWRFDTDFY